MRNKAENHQLECETISKDEIEREKKVKSWNLEDGSVRVTVPLQLKGVEEFNLIVRLHNPHHPWKDSVVR